MEKTLTKVDFAPVFKVVLDNAKIPDHIIKGFKRCGLFPFDPEAVDYTKCVQNTLESIQQDAQHDQVEELSSSDFKSTHKVLTTLKSHLLDRAGDVDSLLKDLKQFEEQILGSNIADTDAFQENIVMDDNYATVEEYEVNTNGFLFFVDENGSAKLVNEPKINILYIKFYTI